MRLTKSRFVTVCQQALIVGTAFAVLGPAADVISLDVITRPGDAAQLGAPSKAPRPAPVESAPSRVETAPVDAEITDVPVDEKAAAPADAKVPEGGHAVQTAPQKVKGYGTVGVTWQPGTRLEDDDIAVQARTRKDGRWSDWAEVKYEESEGPDPTSPEGRAARPGTDPLVVGDVDEVQTRVVTAPGVETPDLQMAVVDPGQSKDTAVESPKITGQDSQVAQDATIETDQGDLKLQAGTTVARPTIYSRAQWGANESWRKGTVEYGKIAAGFIHHTVNANDYTRDQVPGILRSIYAYHTQTKGWNDIGYNFLIDRFGRIWEGRYGGVDKAVVGAHTQGYNSYSFAASAIGNFEEGQPSSYMLDAYARLYAWKLGMNGIAADDTSQWVGSKYFKAINGHRDAGQTACPGKYLYARIPDIRTAARKIQVAAASGTTSTTHPTLTPTTGTPPLLNLDSSPYPDLVARRSSDNAAVVLPTGGVLGYAKRVAKGTGFTRYVTHAVSPDLTGDGKADLFVRNATTGMGGVRPGRGDGTFAASVTPLSGFTGYDLLTPVGPFDGDAYGDLVGRKKETGNLILFHGNGKGTQFTKSVLLKGQGAASRLVATGDVTGDGKADLLVRSKDGTLYRYNGDGAGHVGAPTALPGRWSYPVLTGYGDLTGDGRPDILVGRTDGTLAAAPSLGTGGFGKLVPIDGTVSGLSGVHVAQVLGTPEADIVGFDGDTGMLEQHTGRTNVAAPIVAGVSFKGATAILNAGDWDGDGRADVLTRRTSGAITFHKGLGEGKLAPGKIIDTRDFNTVAMLTAPGDITGDGKPDLIGVKSGRLVVFPGNGVATLGVYKILNSSVTGTYLLPLGRWDSGSTIDTGLVAGTDLGWLPSGLGTPKSLPAALSNLRGLISAGDVTSDGRTDLLGRGPGGGLFLLPGTSSGFGTRRYLGGGFAGYDLIG